MRRLMVIVLVTLLPYHASAQFGVLGRGLPMANSAVTPPCDLVSGCVAAYSAQRALRAAYSGALFQLQKTGGSTQDIGVDGTGRVNMATIASFCGATSGSGKSTTTTNSCKVTLIYDQSGNGNTLTGLTTVGCPTGFCAPCPANYAVNAAGKPIFVNSTDANCFYAGPNPPTGTPTGNAAITISVVANDQIWSTEDNPYAYGLNFGMFHDFAVANTNGNSFGINLRGGYSASLVSTPFLSMGLDLEQDSDELYYGFGDYTTAEKALSPNVHSFGSVGDFSGTASYDPGTTNITLDFQNGQRTYTHTYGSLNMGSGTIAEIRQGYTGDGTASLQGAWYEGTIYASTLSLADQHALQANGRTYYNISAPTTCSNGGVDLIGGAANVTGAWGLRQLNPSQPGPVAIIQRASDNAQMVLGTTNGNCSLDTSGAATFCVATTCHLVTLYNQLVSVSGYTGGWTGRTDDSTRMTSGGSGTSGPTFTSAGLGSNPVMTFGATSTLTSFGTTNAITRPWSLLAAVSRTSGGAFFADGGGTNALGGTGTSTLQVKSGSSTGTQASTDGTWHAVAGTVSGTTLAPYVNGTAGTPGSGTTADTASATWVIGAGSFVGAMTELYLVNGTAVTAMQVGNLSTVQRSVYGF